MDEKQTQYDEEIGELNRSIAKQQDRLVVLRQMRAVETCRFKVGDKVKNNQGKRGEVIRVYDSWGSTQAEVGLYKKDGTMGQRTTKAYSWENWQVSE